MSDSPSAPPAASQATPQRHYVVGCCDWHTRRAAERRERLVPYGEPEPCSDHVDPVYPADPDVAAMTATSRPPTLPWIDCPSCTLEGTRHTMQVCLHGSTVYEFMESRGVKHLDTLVAEYRALRAAAEDAGTYRSIVGLPDELTTVRDDQARRDASEC